MRGVLGLLFCAFAAVAAADDVYRYTDANGVVHYTDRAPDRHAKPIRLAPVSGPRPPAKPSFYSPEALREAARFAVRVESPTPAQRVRPGRSPVIAAVSVMPALVRGFHLVYQLDGRAVTTQPVDVLSLPLAALAAGHHALQVVLLDERGREVARSSASPFEVDGISVASSAPKVD